MNGSVFSGKKTLVIGGIACVGLLIGILFVTKKHVFDMDVTTPDRQDVYEVNLRQYTTPVTRDQLSDLEKFDIHVCLMAPHEKDCDYILADENMHIFLDPILEQCDIMKGMQTCEKYTGSGSLTFDMFDLTPKPNAPEATYPERVVLEDGETYILTIGEAKKTINGRELRMLAYNGSIPGPQIQVVQGSRIFLEVVNAVDDIETTVHHHGLRHSVMQDGVPKDMGGFDTPIISGGSLVYELYFPDAGIFRYHPHIREELQQELGLYGNYLVVPDRDEEILRNEVDREELMIIDDILLQEDGRMYPFDKNITNLAVMGRFGNVSLINGMTEYELSLDAGERVRIYLTNVANARPFNLVFSGMQTKFVGGDIGLSEREEWLDSIVISPAERVIIELTAPSPGVYQLVNRSPDGDEQLGRIIVQPGSVGGQDMVALQDDVNDFSAYDDWYTRPVEKRLRLDVSITGMDHPPLHAAHGALAPIRLPGDIFLDPSTIERYDMMPIMNEATTSENTLRKMIDEDTGDENMDITWRFTQGDLIKISITNDATGVHPMQHPIHFHGQRFIVLSVDGQKNTNRVWKDTVLVPTGSIVEILLDASNPGMRMMHCHIAEHLSSGMMGMFEVVSPDETTMPMPMMHTDSSR